MGTGKYVLRGSGTRTIYLYTVDGAVCSHYKEKVDAFVRDLEGGGGRMMGAEMCACRLNRPCRG